MGAISSSGMTVLTIAEPNQHIQSIRDSLAQWLPQGSAIGSRPDFSRAIAFALATIFQGA
jgi:hypothetical protein